MENNTPNYAKWIPEAGGYVHNGTVVSKDPIYDNAGKQQIEVDITNLTTPNQLGTQGNQANSGVDVNAPLTEAGSLGSLTTNTSNTSLGTINTPATMSNIAGSPSLSPVEQVTKEYDEMVATNNLKGQIDKLTQLQQLTGVDYTNTIKDLWNQRSQKIQNEDNAYTQAIAQARQAGNEALAQDLALKQQAYRNNVGYYDQVQMDLQNKQDILQTEYQTTYTQGISDITNGILAQLSSLINFQYNPQTDLRLQVAQGYAVGAIKEQMNRTGMYYSTMTQSAITRAVAELVPVYEQMARDEIKENISLLQNVGNYLMNLENMQLSIWEAQVNMKIKTNAEKRAQINQAIENANARGYYTNEEAVLLGVPAGTESYEARIRAEEKQNEIEKEQRQLAIDKELASYNRLMSEQLYERKLQLEIQYGTNEQRTVQATAYQYDADGNKTGEYKYEIPYDEFTSGYLTASTGTQNPEIASAITEMTNDDGNYDEAKVIDYLGGTDFATLPSETQVGVINNVGNNYYKQKILEYSNEFGDDYNKTKQAVLNAYNDIKEFASLINNSNVSDSAKAYQINNLYKTLFNQIDNSKRFDYIFTDLGDDKKQLELSKAYAKACIVAEMERESNNPILQSLAKDEYNELFDSLNKQQGAVNFPLTNYQIDKEDGIKLIENAVGVGSASLNIKNAVLNPIKNTVNDTISSVAKSFEKTKTNADKNTSLLTSTKSNNNSGKKVYVAIPSYNKNEYSSDEEFVKSVPNLYYDKSTGKAYYYEADGDAIKAFIKKTLKQ